MDQLLYQSFLEIQQSFRDRRDFVLAHAGEPAKSFKDDDTPSTDADIETENYIVEKMKHNFPDLPILGEESGYDPKNLPSACWLVDPIDGTKSFIANVPAFTGMAVLVVDGRAEASVIYNPTTDDMYAAIKGRGAQKNGQNISLADTPMPKLVACKKSVLDELTIMLRAIGMTTERAPNGAGYGFSRVVDGTVAARFHMYSGPNIHDHAPGALLVSEAGGTIIPLFEDEYQLRTKSFVACHPQLADFVRHNLDALRRIENPEQAVLA